MLTSVFFAYPLCALMCCAVLCCAVLCCAVQVFGQHMVTAVLPAWQAAAGVVKSSKGATGGFGLSACWSATCVVYPVLIQQAGFRSSAV
jgi:hypothetical protein